MMYLYCSMAKTDCREGFPEYIVKEVSVCREHRSYLTRSDFIWHLICLGKYKKYIVLNSENRVIHTSYVMGRCFKFPFLSKTSAHIGGCFTQPDYRGRGIYPKMLDYICSTGGFRDYYMLVSEENSPSIKGIEKAGFLRVGAVKKRCGQWIRTQ